MTTSTSASTSNDTFHLFPYLPWELRACIWQLTVSPRTIPLKTAHHSLPPCAFSVDIRRRLNGYYDRFPERSMSIRLLHTSSPISAALHACQEARTYLTHPACGANGYGYYEKMSSSNLANRQQLWLWEEKIPSPYIWVNFEVDMIDIGVTRFGLSGESTYASKFRRVKFKPMGAFAAFECLTPDPWLGEYTSHTSFPHVKEAEVELPRHASIAEWADYLPWDQVEDLFCGLKDIVFTDPSGKRMTLAEIIETFPEGRPPGYALEN